ncbi:MAG: SpoIID/LytB domain-containing protein [Actinomycetota bacterium]|nr:SpoIID/LytB domain-containing protein [Actinomycetota bacterium]
MIASGLAVVALSESLASAAVIVTLPPSGNVTVDGHGNGHGHGMAQYGARGAALAGLDAHRIVAFFYPGTTLRTLAASTIRVQLSGAGPYTVVGSAAGLTVTGVAGALPVTGVSRYRLVPSAGGLAVQALKGAAWTNVKTGLPARADFGNAGRGFVQVFRPDGTSSDYRGTVGALRSGSGEITVNRLPLDYYALGVVPRESPSFWPAAALQAQAIAARSYARNAVETRVSAAYDICDTDSCQVYGGLAYHNSAGARLYGEEPQTNAAVNATANQVLQYAGATIFAQFSASDGGLSVAGGKPYLVAQADPYDNAASGDPYLNWTHSVAVSSIASYYGLRSVTQIEIASRDGHGQWGGRVLSAFVDGVSSNGASQHLATTGFGLQAALRLPHNWFNIRPYLVNRAGGSVVRATPSSVAFFHRTATGAVRAQTYQTGAGWQAPVDLGAPASGLIWDPDAASWGDGHLDVVAADPTHHLVIQTFVPGSGWVGWRQMSWLVASSPAAVSPTPNSLDVFWRGPNLNRLWMVHWTQALGWVGPVEVPGVTNAASGPDATAAVDSSKAVTVAYRGTDNFLWTVTQVGAHAWSAPARVNSGLAMPGTPAPVDPSVGNGAASNVYFTATNGTIYHASWNAVTRKWSQWWAVPAGGSTSAPDVASDSTTHLDLVAGAGGQPRSISWNPGPGWRPWADLN